MFDSNVSVSSFIANLQSENDVSIPISNSTYVEWLNALQQLLYGEVIREIRKTKILAKNYYEDSYSDSPYLIWSTDSDGFLKNYSNRIVVDTVGSGVTIEDFTVIQNNGKVKCACTVSGENLNLDDIEFVLWKNWEGYKISKSAPVFIDNITITEETTYQIEVRKDGNVLATSEEIEITPSSESDNKIVLGGMCNSLKMRLYWSDDATYTNYKIQKGTSYINLDNTIIALNSLSVGAGEDNIRFEDIHDVYIDGMQLTKVNIPYGAIFNNTFYKFGNDLKIVRDTDIDCIELYTYIRPSMITVSVSDTIGSGNVMLPIEFLQLARAKLRGEAYKLANEDNLAAKWLNDYNALLETFKAWLSGKQAEFGM